MQRKKTDKKDVAAERAKFEEELVAEVEHDFAERQQERLKLERQWELNMNFLMGNQYCGIDGRGELSDDGLPFSWQKRGVFNHIAPIISLRQAKFSRIEPSIGVRPESDDDKDVNGAKVGAKLLESVFKNAKVGDVVKKVTAWSETCGTGFYKVVWNNCGGGKIGEYDGKDIYEGDAEVIAVSPFEIFPDSIYNEDVNNCLSIIHAKAVARQVVEEKYGVKVNGGKVGVFSLEKNKTVDGKEYGGAMDDAVVVIEKYEKPSAKYPTGRLITVADGKLLYYGELPYLNGKDRTRVYPFVKQDSLSVAGRFFGASIIERLIPVQKAYNAVKNRKHEFLNRLSMGIMKVEDGSVDVDDLAEEGLSPGKVLVYRQGFNSPEMLEGISMPSDFNEEETKLLNEFVIISGVSDVTSSSSNAAISSGTALQILIEQDNDRLLESAEAIRKSYVEIAKHIIRLYAQFDAGIKVISVGGENGSDIIYVDKYAFASDDVYLENENELLYTERQRKEILFKLYSSGLLADENGKVRKATKEKMLNLLGYKDLDYGKGLSALQEEKAQTENEIIKTSGKSIDVVDDDEIHAEVHTRYVLSEYKNLGETELARFYEHIEAHKKRAGATVTEQTV